ncbi:unnamed protein product, partial [Mesorhabditis spiculigera]
MNRRFGSAFTREAVQPNRLFADHPRNDRPDMKVVSNHASHQPFPVHGQDRDVAELDEFDNDFLDRELQEPDQLDALFGPGGGEDDWMDEIDVSLFASDVAATGFDVNPKPNPATPVVPFATIDGRRYLKPCYSYSCMIALALRNSKTGRLTVSEIYAFMCENFPYFKAAPSGWKNSVRHNLSLNKCFMKIELETLGPQGRKACLWMIRPEKATKMETELLRWRDKDVDDAIGPSTNIEAVLAGTFGVPREDRTVMEIENQQKASNEILLASNSGMKHDPDTPIMIKTETRPLSTINSHPGPSRAVLDLNDRLGITLSETKPPLRMSSSNPSFPVRVADRPPNTLNQAGPSVGPRPPPHKPNILRRSTALPAVNRFRILRSPVKGLGQLMPSDLSRLEITPKKEDAPLAGKSPQKEGRQIIASPVRDILNPFGFMESAVSDNTLMDCALDQSPMKDAPVSFSADLVYR